MSPTLTALEQVVSRHGRAALDDPMTLTAALRSLTEPPPDDDVVALADAARSGAAERLRAAAADGVAPEEALDSVAGADATGRARWATAQIGAALGLLPRSLATDRPAGENGPTAAATGTAAEAGPADTAGPAAEAGPPAETGPTVAAGGAGSATAAGASPGAEDPSGRGATGDEDTVRLTAPRAGSGEPTGTPERATGTTGRRRALLLIGAVVVLLLGIVGGVLLLGDDGSDTTAEAGATTGAAPGTSPDGAAQTGGPTGGATATPEPPADPRAAFTDPVLRATAEPYLRIPGTTCTRREQTEVVIREQVVCQLGTSGAGIFARYFDPTSVVRLREFMGTDETVVPGSRRELRWEYVQGRPGVRAGIPVGQDRDGVGTRVRWLGLDPAAPLLYFDEEATGTIVQLSLLDGGDQEQLRRLWADPAG